MKSTIVPFQVITFLALLSITTNVSSQCDTLDPDLGNDTIICQDGVLILDAGPAESYLWQDGSTSRTISITSPGMYFVTVKNECSTAYDTIMVSQVSLPLFNLKIPDKKYFCKGEKVKVEADGLSPITDYNLDWSVTPSKDAYIEIDTTSDITLSVTDLFGCFTSKKAHVEFQYPFEHDKVLLATYNNALDKNMVIWCKTPKKRTRSYSIFTGAEQNTLLADQEFSKSNMIIDQKTNPHLESAIYNLKLTDSCANSSLMRPGLSHQTMLLQTDTTALGKTILRWNKYRGFDCEYYYIYRGPSGDKLELIDSVKDNRLIDRLTYTDAKAEPGKFYYYQVAVKTPEPIYYDIPDDKKGKGGPFAHSLSNLEDNKLRTGIHAMIDPGIRIYPNPFGEKTTVSYTLYRESHIRIELLDITGRHLAEILDENQRAGNYRIPVSASRPGIYFIRLTADRSGIFTYKLIHN